jgi:penicillin amidase
MPLLANDPHLAAQMPSIWYQVGLYCQPKSPACPFEVAGFSFAGAPGVIIGHNDRIAWGMTNLGPDVMDLYIEKINPENPDQYEVNGEWVDMRLVQETIQAAGAEPLELTVRYTRHGPLITDTYLPEDFSQKAGIPLPEQYAIALRWTALEPTYIFPAIWKINIARNWEDFRAAARNFAVPSQNLIFADVDGNIGYQSPGNIPIRAAGDGMLPVPGWTDEYEWSGYIPFEQLPYAFNPPAGYIITANNAVIPADYPYLLSKVWTYGYRAACIDEMIAAAPGLIDSAYIQKMQGDNTNLNARHLVPVLLELAPVEASQRQALQLLQDWDYGEDMDSAAAALFEAFWKHLLAATFHDELPEDSWPSGDDRWYTVVRNLVEQPDSPWWDNRNTRPIEVQESIFGQAFAAAVTELESSQGKDPEAWSWGKLHTLTIENQTLGRSGIAPIEALFNRGPYQTAGGNDIVNATGWDATLGYQVAWLPSMRMIVDLGALQNSQTIHLTGQSGHAYNKHYADMTDLWRTIQYQPMLWERRQIEAEAEGRLRLTPAGARQQSDEGRVRQPVDQ